MSNRKYLKGSILLYGENEHGKFPHTFSVKKIISSPDTSSSAVCYSASCNNINGVLKEFYPINEKSLLRNDDGQLIRKPDMEKENAEFDKLLSEYIEPYNMMLDIRQQGDIATFIPPFEIYYGCDKNLNNTGTAYIWTPNPELETFDKICTEIHDNPTITPEHNLVKVLYSIESLTKCVCELHKANLIHRDIKPSNFGFLKRNNELLTQTISFFDVDTVCSIYNVPSGYARGTEEYMEPEALSRDANNLTDIYAIGATLFNAIIVTDRVRENNYQYNPSFYSELKELVDESELIQASEANSHPFLRSILTRILQKCLSNRNTRYQSCMELLEDINDALYYVVPAEITSKGKAGEQWILADVEKLKTLDANKEKNSTFALQYHLYTHPLYEKCTEDKDTIDVLVIGFGRYSQKFTDLALQIAQIPDKRIRMTIVSSSAEDKSIYLSERPAMSRFFNIDGSLPKDSESYGDIRFIEHTFAADESCDDTDFLKELLSDDFKPDYSFVATGNNKQNFSIAKSVKTFCMTSFAWEGSPAAKHNQQGMMPVYVNADISKYPLFSEIERMAFNVHLVWNKNLNISFHEVRNDYRKPYNHNSCVSFVLSMKYKLHGIGIDIDSVTCSETARKYLSHISSHKSAKEKLIYLEHRRWVTEKLCLGYKGIDDLNDCANGKTKDEKKKRHVCLLRSTLNSSLSSAEWTTASGQTDKKKWDNPSPDALDSLDDLDRMSVELHRVYLQHANSEKKNNLLNGEIVSEISVQTEDDALCITTLQELLTCMKDIWNNDSEQCKRYEGLRSTFTDSVKNSVIISERNKKYIKQLVTSLHEKFYPVYASQQYRDYKQEDINLVENTPFILTYSDSLYMVIPFVSGNNTKKFANLAAPTVINPSRLIYIAYCSNTSELDAIRETIPRISNYMKKKEFRANVEFIIGYRANTLTETYKRIEQEFRILSCQRISKVKLMESDSETEYITSLKQYFKTRSRNKMNFLFEANDTVLSDVMETMNVFEEFSSYRYNSVKMEFTALHNCDLVKYIHAKPFITVTDMFSFKISNSTSSNKPEFYNDYQDLWNKYCSNTKTWKQLTGLLKAYSVKQDLIAVFNQDERFTNERIYNYIVPFRCKNNVELIIDALIAENIISEESCISSLTTHSCKVIIRTRYENSYDTLFSRIDILMQTDFVYCHTDVENHTVRITYNNLSVNNLDCNGLYDSVYELMDFLSEKGYLINLSYDKTTPKANFTYATPEIKNLMTLESRILEIYTYHKAKETGAFDDIRSSFEIDWENNAVSNEFDCILTKGFTALFVECKATTNLKSEIYTKLSHLAKYFGINAKAVLITDSLDSKNIDDFNSIQKLHGEQLDVITISNKTDIDNIGNVLLKCIDR